MRTWFTELFGIEHPAYANRYQKMSGLALEMREMAGIAHQPEDTATARIIHDYTWSTALRVAGGADEVLRHQISERVPGMPGEVRVDKNVPFHKLQDGVRRARHVQPHCL